MVQGSGSGVLTLMASVGFMGLGLGVFFLGLVVMKTGIAKAAGADVRRVLVRATGGPILALGSGLVLSLVFQSTSLVAVVLMELLDADLMDFQAATAVVLGSNIGASLTVQFLALKLYEWAIPVALCGLAIAALGRRKDRLRSAGIGLFGFGLLYGGIHLVTLAAVPLTNGGFLRGGLLAVSRYPVPAGLFGLVLTAVVQSNGIANGILLSLARQGLIPIATVLAVISGANLGSGTLALLAAFPSGRRARGLAVVNALVNVAGLLWVVPAFGLIVRVLAAVSPSVPQALASAHILFNILASLTVLPVIPLFSRVSFGVANRVFPPLRDIETVPWLRPVHR